MMTFLFIVAGLAAGYFLGRLTTPPGPITYVRVQPTDDDATMATTGESARFSSQFNRELLALAERLAAKNLVVSELHCNYAAFGCWKLCVERGADTDKDWQARREVIEIFWDGM